MPSNDTALYSKPFETLYITNDTGEQAKIFNLFFASEWNDDKNKRINRFLVDFVINCHIASSNKVILKHMMIYYIKWELMNLSIEKIQSIVKDPSCLPYSEQHMFQEMTKLIDDLIKNFKLYLAQRVPENDINEKDKIFFKTTTDGFVYKYFFRRNFIQEIRNSKQQPTNVNAVPATTQLNNNNLPITFLGKRLESTLLTLTTRETDNEFNRDLKRFKYFKYL